MKVKINRLIERSFRILQYLLAQGPTRFGELSELLAPIPPSTLTRILKALGELGYIGQAGAAYQALKNPLNHHEDFFPGHWQVALERLAVETGLSVGLFGVLGEATMKILANSNRDEQPAISEIGMERPFIPTHGFGKIFLAWSSPAIQRQAFQRLTTEIRSHRYPRWEDWEMEAIQIRKNQFVLETGEFQEHIARAAVPVFFSGERCPRFALGVLGFTDLDKRRGEIETALKRTSAEVLARWSDEQAALRKSHLDEEVKA